MEISVQRVTEDSSQVQYLLRDEGHEIGQRRNFGTSTTSVNPVMVLYGGSLSILS